MRTGNLIKDSVNAYEEIIEISYSATEVATGIELLNNQKITVSEALNTCNIISVDGEGEIVFVAGETVSFVFPSSQFGWVGDTPSFKVGYTYHIIYYDGGFYYDNGRLVTP